MLYRTKSGILKVINQTDYINNEIYYNTLINIKFSIILNKPLHYSKLIIDKNIV